MQVAGTNYIGSFCRDKRAPKCCWFISNIWAEASLYEGSCSWMLFWWSYGWALLLVVWELIWCCWLCCLASTVVWLILIYGAAVLMCWYDATGCRLVLATVLICIPLDVFSWALQSLIDLLLALLLILLSKLGAGCLWAVYLAPLMICCWWCDVWEAGLSLSAF